MSWSKLQNYLNFFISRAEISRIRPSVFKCQILKYFVSLWSSSQYCFDSFTLIRNNGHDKRPLDAMKAGWNHIQGSLFPWLREEVDPITEALGRLVTTLDVIGLEAFVPEPPRGPGRPPEDRRALARAFVA